MIGVGATIRDPVVTEIHDLVGGDVNRGGGFFLHSDGTWRAAIQDVESSQAEKLLSAFERHSVQIQTYNFSDKFHDDWMDHPDVVCAELTADEIQRLDDRNHFSPMFPKPCLGIVPTDADIIVGKKPVGNIQGLGTNHDLFSERMCHFLKSLAPCRLGNVVHDGRVLTSWHRLFCETSRGIICTDCLDEVQCAYCSTPIIGDLCVLLGQRPDVPFCFDTRGVGHAGRAVIMILSLDAAAELRRVIPSGYGLFPIIDSHCSAAKAMIQTRKRLDRLAVKRSGDSPLNPNGPITLW